MSMEQTVEGNLDRPIWGAREISAAINQTVRQTHHMLERGYLPADKIGRRWVTTPRRLRLFFTGSVSQ
jgi:hypothetical protein